MAEAVPLTGMLINCLSENHRNIYTEAPVTDVLIFIKKGIVHGSFPERFSRLLETIFLESF